MKLKVINIRSAINILSKSFLFPVCLSLVGLYDELFETKCDLFDPEMSLELGTAAPCKCFGVVPGFPACFAGKLLCIHIDSTKSTSGDGPGSFRNKHITD